MPFLLIFILVPFMELMVFAAVSEHIGIFTALCLAFLTAVIGGAIVRHQGLHTIMAVRHAFDRGALPLTALFDGLCLVAAGALLVTPGFITDTIGFALLFPAFRDVLRHVIKKHTTWSVQAGMHDSGGAHYQNRAHRADPDVIEAEYEPVSSDTDKS